jgi:E3 ubiquitin-protein ligase CCNP1IP1
MTLIRKYKALKTRSKVRSRQTQRTSYLLTTFTGLQIDLKTLQQKNFELIEMYREKSKKQAQTQHLYDTLKKRVMTSQVQTAASDSVAQAINSISSIPRPQTYGDLPLQPSQTTNFRPVDHRSSDQYHRSHHSRSPSQCSRTAHIESGTAAMPPPPGPLGGLHSRKSCTPTA